MIAANSTFQSESALQNRASVVRPGRGRRAREIEKVTIRIKDAVEAIRSIAADARFRNDVIGRSFPGNHQGAEERPKFPFAGNVRFRFVIDQSAGTIGDAEAQARGVIDFSGHGSRSAGREKRRECGKDLLQCLPAEPSEAWGSIGCHRRRSKQNRWPAA